jgi:GTP pyrophosphokinase
MTIERTGGPAAASPTGWGRSRLVWLGGRSHNVPAALEPVIGALKANHPKSDVALVKRAYEVAERAHDGQMRKSGEPYITHPVAVTTILAELGMPDVVLAAALLHDTVEDTDYSLDQVRSEFGDEIALMVDGVTKLDKVHYGEAAQAETVRKMVIAMAKDIRVLVIKLADRLHNARTWKYVSQESASRKARETLEIYAPLAHRLGVNTVKWELEDLSFRTLYPRVYDEIDHLVAERAPAREEYLGQVRKQIEADLKTHRLKAVVTGRPKHHYSIYQKMIVRGRDFEDIFDLVGVRVLVDTINDCYTMLGAVHARWTPMPGRFKDYIAMPKFNLYQSLHTTVLGPGGRPVEIQIRTHEMHRRAEYGVAAHWKYKSNAAGRAQAGAEPGASEMGWLRQLVDWQRETADPGEFLDSLRYEMAGSQVYVFTPKGDVQALPAGATPVDFAYAVHTEVGHRTVGAKVNGKLVPLDRKLDNGETVEIISSKAPESGPSKDWLSFVASPRAKNKIRQWFTKERREEAVEEGKTALARAMRKQNMPIQRLMSAEAVHSLAVEMRYQDVEGLYGRRRRRRGDARRGDDPGGLHPGQAHRQPGRHGRRHGGHRRLGEDRAVLHAGPGRPDRRIHHPVPGRLGPPRRVSERGAAQAAARAARRGLVGGQHVVDVPRPDAGRGARQARPAVRPHPGPLGQPREHPVRLDHHHPGAGRAQQVRLRDGRHRSPGLRPVRRPTRAGRPRRPTCHGPEDRSVLTVVGARALTRCSRPAGPAPA